MSLNSKQKIEEWFVQGLHAAQGGLAENICPYDWETDDGMARINWSDGWCFGKFVAVQKLRKDMTEQIKRAIQFIFSFQDAYAESYRIEHQGLLKAGFKYLSAKKDTSEITRQILQSKEFRLLKELNIQVYLPYLPSEAPYTFKIYDNQMNVFGNNSNTESRLRRIVTTYGERHGVQQAWHDYAYAEEIGSIVASALGNHS